PRRVRDTARSRGARSGRSTSSGSTGSAGRRRSRAAWGGTRRARAAACPSRRRTTRLSSHADLRNGDHETAPPGAHHRHLLDDLRLEVPGKYEHIVGLRPLDLLGRSDRDVRSGEIPALLVRAAIDGVVEEIGSDSAVVEQRVALAWSTVADDRLS